jgi:hypothetical protein
MTTTVVVVAVRVDKGAAVGSAVAAAEVSMAQTFCGEEEVLV